MRSLSHDLRTPLNSALGYAIMIEDCIEDDAPKEEIIDCAKNIQTAVQRLVEMLDKSTQLAHITAGNIDIHSTKISFSDLLEKTKASFRKKHNGNPLIIENNVTSHQSVFGDFSLLKQALEELLENALIFKSGKVVFECLVEDEHIYLTIADDGRGFDDEQREQLLSPFKQSRDAKSLGAGCGVGWNIAEGLIKLHKGKLTIKNNNSGTLIRITLPNPDKL